MTNTAIESISRDRPRTAFAHQATRSQMDYLARKAWDVYRAEIADRSQPFDRILESYFNLRTDNTFIIPLNSHVPVMLSEVFGDRDGPRIIAIAVGHLYLDTFTQVLDDIADSVAHDNEDIHLSHLLLIEGLRRLNDVSGGSAITAKKIQEAVEDTMMAERALWAHKRVVSPYSEADFQLVARRGGILRCALYAYAASTGGEEVAARVKIGLLQGALAVQLIDDLLDWEDDFRDQIYTSPLVEAIQALGSQATHEISSDELARSLIVSGAADRIFQRASAALHQGHTIIEGVGGYSLAGLFKTLQNRVEELQLGARYLAAKPSSEIDTNTLSECFERAGDTRLQH